MSRKFATPERRIPQRRKPIECQYPKCKEEEGIEFNHCKLYELLESYLL